jgi:hypothetical protein
MGYVIFRSNSAIKMFQQSLEIATRRTLYAVFSAGNCAMTIYTTLDISPN